VAKIVHKDIGSLVQPQATFVVAGVNTDPTNLTVKQQDADGLETTILNNVLVSTLNAGSTPVAKTATGIFKLNPGASLTKAGYWFWRFEGTGAATATEETQYIVDPSEFYDNGGLSTRALVGLAETKDWLQQQNINTDNDLELVGVINDISDRFHYEAAREFKPFSTNPAVRNFDITWTGRTEPWYIDGQWMGDLRTTNRTIQIGDMASAPTLVRILASDWTTLLETVSAGNIASLPLVRQPWEPIRELQFQSGVTSLQPGMRVEVTGTWGFPAVPGNVRRAVLDSVAASYDRNVEHYSQDVTPAGSAPEGGTTIVMSYGAQRLLALPPSATAVAWSYRDDRVG
jgi:hypothetical protein